MAPSRKPAPMAVLKPNAVPLKKLRRWLAAGIGRKELGGSDPEVTRAWLDDFRLAAAANANPVQAEALAWLCRLLAMDAQAAKAESKSFEACQRLDPTGLLDGARMLATRRLPEQVRANFTTLIRRLRDAGESETALQLVGILEGVGGGAHAQRERMLVLINSGELEQARQSLDILVEQGRGELVRRVAEWMLVRIVRIPEDEHAAVLARRLLSSELRPAGFLHDVSAVGELIGAFGAVRASGLAEHVDPQLAERAQQATHVLDEIEALIDEAAERPASLRLTHVRLLGMLDRYDEAFAEMAAYLDDHPVTPSAASFCGQVMDRFLRWRHSEGRRMDLVAPLLDEGVFAGLLPRLEAEEAAVWDAWPFARNLQTALNPHPLPPAQPLQVPHQLTRRSPHLRVLIVSSNWQFISPLIERVEGDADAGIVFRTFDFQSLTLAHKAARPSNHYFFDPGIAAKGWKEVCAAAPDFAELVEWADVVMVEWANQPAVVLSQMLPPGKRLVVRLHSYEVFSNWHYFIDWNRVDETAFVADHIRTLFFAQNRLARQARLPTSIVFNRQDFDRRVPPRNKAARQTICMLGWATANKDPIFALEILKALRAGGLDWRLRLVGGDWRPQAGALEAAYRVRFEAMLREPELAGAVEVVPHTDDPLSELSRAAYVISASHREGTHEAVIEALSVGCVPVIRDWPMVARFGGARSQYAPFVDYIVQSPEEAVALIAATPWNKELAGSLREKAREVYGVETSIQAFKKFLKG